MADSVRPRSKVETVKTVITVLSVCLSIIGLVGGWLYTKGVQTGAAVTRQEFEEHKKSEDGMRDSAARYSTGLTTNVAVLQAEIDHMKGQIKELKELCQAKKP